MTMKTMKLTWMKMMNLPIEYDYSFCDDDDGDVVVDVVSMVF